jgi:DNA-binding IclR family transcriptional regulator
MSQWTFLTDHTMVLAVVAQHDRLTAREIAVKLRMTERPVRRIVTDLEARGYLRKQRYGRVHQYQVTPAAHEAEAGALLRVLKFSQPSRRPGCGS